MAHEIPASLLIAASAAIYVFAMALPFVPAIEIGLALMLLLGEKGIVLVYVCTQVALSLSYLAGRLIPPAAMVRAFACLGMPCAKRLVMGLHAADAGTPDPRVPLCARRLQRYPGLALAALINLPGNAVIGGAGGIAMVAGITRLLPFGRYVMVMATATAPVTLALLVAARL